ncbi:hypothetical protein [uncultured Aquabacterium sp.]|jgi:hypothetical protein|uniref:hypothetical protein n=1 Tax=uncultured Aquabacterium sp. TaxID=158753 RepID=UPI0026157C58|nr:hypothetical protein [uncultured Aquabacterium sp.]
MRSQSCLLAILLSSALVTARAEERPADAQPVPCSAGKALGSRYTPVNLYLGAVECAKQPATFEAATNMFVLAGVYGRYDILRVKDESAHQAVSVMRMAIDGHLSHAFRQHLRHMAGSELGKLQLCAMVQRAGPPAYFPSYMVQHGLHSTQAALHGRAPTSPLHEDLDTQAAWTDAVEGYLHCSETR